MEENKNELIYAIDIDLETISQKVEEVKNGLPVKEIMKETYTLIDKLNDMEHAEKEYEEKYLESKKLFLANKKLVQDKLEELEKLAIREGTDTLKIDTRHVTNVETGEVTTTTKISTDLPTGMTYKRGRVSFDYDEKLVPDEYFKVERKLKKTEVKKAIEAGKLPRSIATAKYGTPSLSLDSFRLKKSLAEKEAKEKEEAEKEETNGRI